MPIKPSAVIFDWDNTLVDSWPAIAEAVNRARAAFGLEIWTLEQIRERCTRAARDSFPEWFGENWEKAYELYYKGFDEIRRRRAISALPGAPELVEWLWAQKIPAFIVSNKRGDYLRFEVERLQWRKYFVGVAGAQDAARDKPAREHVDHALGASGVVLDETVWFVGDSETDMVCARNAGCTPVLIGSKEEAARLGVERVFADCRGVLESLGGGL